MSALSQLIIFAQAAESSPDIMALSPWKWVGVASSLLVLILVVRFTVWKKVTQILEDRAKNISDSLENAKNKKQEAKELEAQHKAALQNAKLESAKIIKDSKSRAMLEYNAIIDAAKREAAVYKEKARVKIQQEKEEMLAEVKNEITKLALEAASTLVKKNMDTKENQEYVSKIISKEGDF